MSQDYRQLETDLLLLVESMSEGLTHAEIQEVRAFIDVGEYGLAFETLCCIIKDEQKSISESVRSSIGRLAHQMGVTEEFWGDIARPVVVQRF